MVHIAGYLGYELVISISFVRQVFVFYPKFVSPLSMAV